MKYMDKICDICGQERNDDCGIDIKFYSSDINGDFKWGICRENYCAKCSKKIIPILCKALDEIHDYQKLMSSEPEEEKND